MKNKLATNFKKITSYVLALSIVFTSFGFVPAVQASPVGPIVTIGSQSASNGATINVPVNASNFANAVAGMDFSVQYDPALLTYTGLTQNDISGHGLLTANSNTNTIIINWFDSVALNTDNGTLLTLNFTVISEATANANLSFTGITALSDSIGDPVAASFVGGVISLNPAKAITAFSFPEGVGVINEGDKTIAVTVPYGTSVTALVPTIVITGASVNPASGVAQDFTNPVTYTVTAADSTTQAYVVTVSTTANPDIAAVAADKAALVDGSIQGANSNLSNITVALTNPLPSLGANGSTITWVSNTPTVISNDGQTVVRPAFGAGNAIVTMTATIAKGVVTDTKVFILTVIKLPSTIATVTSETYTVSAGGTASETITNVPFGTSKTDFLAALTKGDDNQTWDNTGITDPVVTGNALVVTAQDGTTIVTYTVTTALNPAKAITAFSFPEGSGTVNEGAHTIAVTVPYGTSVTALVPTIVITGASVNPASGVAQDFTNPVTYTVTAADGLTQIYVVTVTIAASSGGGGGGGGGGAPTPTDTSAPTSVSIIINSGAATTTSRAVTLTLSASDSSSIQMMISSSTAFSGANWENFSTTKLWQLTGENGIKTVYVKFKDAYNNISGVVSESIDLSASSIIEPQVLGIQITDTFAGYIQVQKNLLNKIDKALTQRVAGKILLQVQDHGEAWYVDMISQNRFYLADGAKAYGALRKFGLGITNKDLSKIPVGIEKRFLDVDTDADGLADKLEEGLGTDKNKKDTDGDGVSDYDEVIKNQTNPSGAGKLVYDNKLLGRLKGRIILQVESRGEAWYINPADGKRYYMKDGGAAYQIMRFLSLGITNENIRKINIGD